MNKRRSPQSHEYIYIYIYICIYIAAAVGLIIKKRSIISPLIHDHDNNTDTLNVRVGKQD